MPDPTPHLRPPRSPEPPRGRRTGWDRWARVYAALERLALGRELERAREATAEAAASWVGSIPGAAPSRWLVLGDGDGRGLQALLQVLPQASFVSVDGSRDMIARSRRRLEARSPTISRLARGPSVTWIHADLRGAWRELPCDEIFDGIVTSFFLDCLTPRELAELWSRGVARLRPVGAWIVTDFLSTAEVRRLEAEAGTPGGWRSLRQALLLRLLYAAFRGTTSMGARELPDLAAPFADDGWTPVIQGHAPSLLTGWCLWRRPAPSPDPCPHPHFPPNCPR
jgi:hypothetical protein